jgi:hypothetical protein
MTETDSSDPSSYVGKLVMVGITRVNPAGEAVAQLQYHGRIREIGEEGIRIETPDGKQMMLPPALESLQVAAPGEYRERASGVVVNDPDLISSWEIREPAESGAAVKWSFRRTKVPAKPGR